MKKDRRTLLQLAKAITAGTLMFFLLIPIGCQNSNRPMPDTQENSAPMVKTYPKTGSIERLTSEINELIPTDAELEIIAEGFDWSEGPLWVSSGNMLLFSDIPPNKVMKWTEENGLETYLHPSGFTGENTQSKEPGANGLLLNKAGQLVLCQHGDRRMAQMEAPLDQPAATFSTLADRWQGKRFNSPNDAIFDASWNLLFTDPPYGLPQQATDPSREIPFQGVYHLSAATGAVQLLTDELSRPNGLALSPDGQTLYVANSDPERAIWMAYDYDSAGKLSNGRVFYDATDQVNVAKGLPDGLKVDKKGNLWATGPGGVWIFAADGRHLGTIKTGQATSNCAFNDDQSVFYMTADMYVLRLKLK